jgi:YbgC/YbaW family acyl-CoA thioester hydrolase
MSGDLESQKQNDNERFHNLILQRTARFQNTNFARTIVGQNRGEALCSGVMAYEYKVQRRVEFADTDMAGLMHFSNFFRFMETAEHGFFRSLGFSVVMTQTEPPVSWPRVHASCDYSKPVRFEDLVEVHLLVKKKSSRTLTYEFRFSKIDGEASEEIAKGTVTAVCVNRDASGKIHAVHIPAEFAEKIEVAPTEMFS